MNKINETIILLGHGSRIQGANKILKNIAEIIKSRYDGNCIEPAFLEFAEPNINDLLENKIALGCNHIYVIPYFLYSGNHVSRDIPEILEGFRQKYPGVRIELGEPIGIDERLAELVMEKIEAIKIRCY